MLDMKSASVFLKRAIWGRSPFIGLVAVSIGGLALAAPTSAPAADRGRLQASAESDRASALAKLKTMFIEPTADRLVQYAAQGDITVVRLLLTAGVPVSAINVPHRATALHNAAAQGHLEVVRLLLDQGATIDALDARGTTPLCNASFYGRTAVAALLLAKGAAIEPKLGMSTFPLLAAVQSGKPDMVALLLSRGARPDSATPDGLTPERVARMANRQAVLRQLQATPEEARP
jgi:ankyrin repeat protein